MFVKHVFGLSYLKHERLDLPNRTLDHEWQKTWTSRSSCPQLLGKIFESTSCGSMSVFILGWSRDDPGLIRPGTIWAAQENHSTEGRMVGYHCYFALLGVYTWVEIGAWFFPTSEISFPVPVLTFLGPFWFQVQTRAPQTLWEKGMNFGVRFLLWLVDWSRAFRSVKVGNQFKDGTPAHLDVDLGLVYDLLLSYSTGLFQNHMEWELPKTRCFAQLLMVALRLCLWQRTSNWTLWVWSWQVWPQTLSRRVAKTMHFLLMFRRQGVRQVCAKSESVGWDPTCAGKHVEFRETYCVCVTSKQM